MDLLENRCKALVLCFTDIANEAAASTTLPFSSPHRKIPSLWIGAADSKYISPYPAKRTMTLRLDAKLTPNARADSLVGTMKGKSDEAIFPRLTTHTDGPNEVNDNGAPGRPRAGDAIGRSGPRRSAIARSSSACRRDTTPRARLSDPVRRIRRACRHARCHG
jgi:hypothetical protein